MTDPDPLIGSVVSGRYRIDAKVGEGGMGAVYRGQHVAMQKPVAIKVLHGAMMMVDEAVKRFEREAIAAGRIDHPNVVGATDFGRLEDGSFFLVLEYVEGSTLVQLLAQEGCLPVARAVAIGRQIASALKAAHDLGVVHRDLKPDNIMLVQHSDGSDRVKILDFGIAKVEAADETQLTQAGSVFGTPQYMSPEQAAGSETDHRVDLYALGLILYEMFCGRPPFEHARVVALLAKHMTEEPPPLADEIPAHLRRLVAALLKKLPKERPPAAEDVLEALTVEGPKSTPLQLSGAALSKKLAGITHAVARAVAAFRERAAPVLQRAAVWAHTTRVRGVPVWGIGAGAVVLLLGLAFMGEGENGERPVVANGNERSATPSEQTLPPASKRRASSEQIDPELKRILALAKRGSQPAVYALEQRDADERGAAEWLALTIGRFRLGKVNLALEACEGAIDAASENASDRELLGALHYFGTREDEQSDRVLEFAAKHLGSHGADLLFDVWSSTSRKTRATEKAWELLDSPSVRAVLSEGLKLALELRAKESCEERKQLMPRLEKFGDERSMIPMRRMAKTRGCGENKTEDCYPCLRGDDAFTEAMVQVAMRNAPRYEWRR